MMKKRLVCLTLALVISSTQVVSVWATREDELREEQAETSEQLDATYATIDSLEAQKEALAAEIDSLDQELVDVMVQINVLKKDISDKKEEIEETQEDLKEAKADKKQQYEAMKTRIQYIYENGGNSAWFQMILQAEDITDMLNKAEYAQSMYDYDRERLEEYTQVVRDVKALESQLEGEEAELEEMKTEQEAQQATLEEQIEQKKETSEDYEAQIATAEAQAEEYAALLQEQSEEIARLEAERIAAEEAAAAAAAEAAAAEEAAAEAAAAAEAEEAAAAESEEDVADDSDYDSDYDSDEDYDSDDDSDTSTYTEDTSSETTESIEESTETTATSVSSSSATGQAIVDYALQFVGNPYVYGGTSLTNGADCSGFVQSVYAHFGYSISRTSYSQMSDGVGVSYSEAQPGDIICYGGHVAIYIGNGQIVHASNSAPYPAGGIKVSDNAAYRTILAVRRIVS